MSNWKPFLPFSNAETVLPLRELGISFDETYLDYIGVEHFELIINESKNVATIETIICFSDEVILDFPSLENIMLVIGAEKGFSSFPFMLMFGTEFLISLKEFRSILRVPPTILANARHSNNGSKENTWDRDIDSMYEIVLPPLSFSVDRDLNFNLEGAPEVSLPPGFIGDTGLVIEAEGVQLYLDSNTNAPRGRPQGFKGLYVESAHLFLPQEFDLGNTILSIFEAGVGNGGVFGNVELAWTNSFVEEDHLFSGPATGTFLDVPFALKELALILDQNIPIQFELSSELLLPFFRKVLALSINVEVDGNFSFELSAANGSSNNNLVQIEQENIFEITLESFTGRSKESLGIFSISGKLKLLLVGLDWPSFEINQLIIDSKGNIDFEGGWVSIPKTFTLDFFGFKIGVNQFGLGVEEEGNNQQQWISLSGEIAMIEELPVKASVEGLKFSWPVRGNGDVNVSMTGIAVEFGIPDTLSFSGSVHYEEITPEETETGLDGHIFRGNIKLNLMVLRLELEAELIIAKRTDANGHEFTMFYIVLSSGLPSGLPIGNTGTCLFDIGGLAGVHAVPNKSEDQNWYQWYLAEPNRNVTSKDKWSPLYDNYAFSARVKIGTLFDDGFSLNLSALLAILIPGPVVLLEGQANLLRPRSELENTNNTDGAFYLLAILDGRAGTLTMNIDVRYSLEDVITIDGGLEAFFDFNNSENWYIYIGRKAPEAKRIRAEVLSLFKANSYFMIDSKSLLTGASIGIDIREKFGPVSFSLIARVSFDAAIFWKPMQMEGLLELYGELALRVFGLGFELYLQILLEGKAPQRYLVNGSAEVGIKLFWPLPDIKLKVELKWSQEGETQPVRPLLKEVNFIHHKGNAVSWPIDVSDDETFEDWDQFVIVPVDSRPVLTFNRPVHNLTKHEVDGRRDPILSKTSDVVGGQEFIYQLDNLELQVREGESWVTIRHGINTGVDSGFVIDRMSILNLQKNIEPNEPQLQLWKFSAGDLSDLFSRESHDDNYPACSSRRTGEWTTVNWRTVDPGTTYEPEFSYAGLQFVCASTGTVSPEVRINPTTTSHELVCPSDTLIIQFPEPVYKILIRVSSEHDTEGSIYSDGRLLGTLQQAPTDRTTLQFFSSVPFDMVKINATSFDQAYPAQVILISASFQTQQSVIEASVATNDPNLNVTHQNENGDLILRPRTFYRLKIDTSIDTGKDSHFEESGYVYFRTDEGPGVRRVRNFKNNNYIELEYTKKLVNQFDTYVDRTFPENGALNFYHSNDIGIQFNEAYVENLFISPLSIRLKDRNGKTLEDQSGSFLEGFFPLQSMGFLAWQQGKEKGGCLEEPQPEILAPYLNFSGPRSLKPNSLYTAELLTNFNTVPIYQFQFTTSRYANFREHILSSHPDRLVKPITLPANKSVSVDFSDTKKQSEKLDKLINDFQTKTGSLSKFNIRNEFNRAKNDFKLQNAMSFNQLDQFVQQSFRLVGMENRPLPQNFEIFKIPVEQNGNHILLIESPEPIEWNRVKASVNYVSHLSAGFRIRFITNQDQTRAYLYHQGGHIFENLEMNINFNYVGAPIPGGGVILKDGVVAKENVEFTLLSS